MDNRNDVMKEQGASNSECKLEIIVEYNQLFNFALCQRKIPVIHKLVIHNMTQELMKDIDITILSEPVLIKETSIHITELGPDEKIDVAPKRVDIDITNLYKLTESISGYLLLCAKQGDQVIEKKSVDITFLAADQWLGSARYPEMLASFVVPNFTSVSDVIQKAAPFMESWQGSTAFTGYQTDNPSTVRIQMAAIFCAIQNLKIGYCVPPASFMVSGQRVRMPQTMIETKLGTCLDFSLLYASCLEAIGLHPIIVLMKGHAYAGAWLTKETFPECIEEDYAALSKRAEKTMNTICLVECTDMSFSSGNIKTFDQAQEDALSNLAKTDAFEMVIDVKRCRLSGVIPLPLVSKELTPEELKQKLECDVVVPVSNNIPQAYEVYEDISEDDQPQNISRLEVWERNLLDLSLRNSFLNFRGNNKAVQFMETDLEELEDILADGKELSINAFPLDWQLRQTDQRIYETDRQKEEVVNFTKNELQNLRVRSFYTEENLFKNMVTISREAKLSFEESGTNSLYLALGFLRWYETPLSEKPHYAPIIMYPVEVVRKVTTRQFRMRLRDEDPQINVTLLEMLRQNFGITISGLNELPQGEKGIDLRKVFYIIRKAVMAQPRFDIEERAVIGLFSFRQFIMWNDLKNRTEDLLKNKVVKSLLEGKLCYEPKPVFLSDDELDSKEENENLAVPMSADSSQLAAICAASKGESFVLHGPPGTGKSQTITNMIANALYQGKRVLFVADKMAALSVVQKRLDKIGLSAFCLELHSNKARKKDVLSQLERTLEFTKVQNPEGFLAKSVRLQNMRDELNLVCKELHKPTKTGKSLYVMVGEYEKLCKITEERLPVSDYLIKNITPDKFEELQGSLEYVISVANTCGNITNHPFALFETKEYTAMLRDNLSTRLKSFASMVIPLEEKYVALCEELHYPQTGTYNSIHQLLSLAQTILKTKGMTKSLLCSNSLNSLEGTLLDLCEQGKQLQVCKKSLLDRFSSNILTYDYQSALRRLKEAEESFILVRGGKTKKLLDEIKFMMINPRISYTKEDLPELFLEIKKYQDLKQYVAQANTNVTSLLENYWCDDKTDFDEISDIYHDAMTLRFAINKMSSDLNVREDIINRVLELCLSDEEKNEFKEIVSSYEDSLTVVIDEENALKAEYAIRMERLHEEPDWFVSIRKNVMTWRNHISELRDWVHFLNACEKAGELGLDQSIEVIRTDNFDVSKFIPAFFASFYYQMIMSIIGSTPCLSDFSGSHIETLKAAFERTESEYQTLLVQSMQARLCELVPDTSASGNFAASSQIAILKKAIKNGGRNLSIRKLFESIPELLQKMCPCMLMSSMSVAQYIDPSFKMFDLVVFDEASQLPTCEAVGAIARGKEVVVVGDPKQLPPTSFFKTQQAEESFEESNLESLLDDCLAISMPQSHLLWHYRSRHESLIAYSNQTYYDGKLYTFPSPNAQTSEVIFVPVEGVYDRGKTKKNVAEAKMIVEELVRRAKDPVLRKDSVGVVTFSLIQQTLIEDMLEERIAGEPELDTLFAQFEEPVFIKNLENVQGDERDVILFSVGYGPDENGKVTMNFGPLNAVGGWRRLNVAITRARKQMMIFSVLRPEQIDLSRTSSEGIAGLKGFLEYAAYGGGKLVAKARNIKNRNMITENWIADMLKNAGYHVSVSVGVSNYKIDIAVKHPKNEKEYILGILCDGETYASCGTARDRNILQESVLTGLGWKLYHVWILDWLDDPQTELEKLIAAIDERIDEILNPKETAKVMDEVETVEKTKETKPQTLETAVSENTESEDVYADVAKKPSVSYRRIYENTKLLNTYAPETIYRNETAIKRVIETIIKTEAPVSKKRLIKTVLSAFEITKQSAKVLECVENVLAKLDYNTTTYEEQIYYWSNDTDIENYRTYRVTEDPLERRNFEEIAPNEIANAIVNCVKEQFGLSITDLTKVICKEFGYLRSSEAIDRQIKEALTICVAQNRISLSEDGTRLLCISE